MKKLINLGIIALSFFAVASIAYAEPTVVTIPKPPIVQWTTFGGLISAIVGLALVIATLAAFLFLIWGGIQWIISGGDKAGLEAAQHRIQASLVGLFIVFASWALFGLVGKFLGIDVFNMVIPSPSG